MQPRLTLRLSRLPEVEAAGWPARDRAAYSATIESGDAQGGAGVAAGETNDEAAVVAAGHIGTFVDILKRIIGTETAARGRNRMRTRLATILAALGATFAVLASQPAEAAQPAFTITALPAAVEIVHMNAKGDMTW